MKAPWDRLRRRDLLAKILDQIFPRMLEFLSSPDSFFNTVDFSCGKSVVPECWGVLQSWFSPQDSSPIRNCPPAESTHYPEPRSGGGLKENRHVAEIKWYHVSYMMTLAGLPLEREHYPGDNIWTRPEHCCFSQLKKEAFIHLNMSVSEYMVTVSYLNMNYATLLNLGWLNVSVFDFFTVGTSGTQHPAAMNTYF